MGLRPCWPCYKYRDMAPPKRTARKRSGITWSCMTINPGDDVELTVYDVTNPPAGTAYAGPKISTSSDVTPLSGAWSLTFKVPSTGVMDHGPQAAFGNAGGAVTRVARSTVFDGYSCECGRSHPGSHAPLVTALSLFAVFGEGSPTSGTLPVLGPLASPTSLSPAAEAHS